MTAVNAIMTGTKTGGAISSQIAQYYDRLFLYRTKELTVLDQFAQVREVPQNNGVNVFFQRYKSLRPATTQLTEGVVPASNELSSSRISAQVKEYGDWTKISTLASMVALDPELSEKTAIFADQAAHTKDRLLLLEIAPKANCSNIYAGSKSSVSAMTVVSSCLFTDLEVRKAVRALRRAKAMMFSGGYWVGVIGPDVEFDWFNDSDFVNAVEYGATGQLFTGEIGKWMGVRFVRCTEEYRMNISSDVDISGGAVHSVPIFGQQSYGTIPLAKAGVKMYAKTTGANDTTQPIPRYSTYGWMGVWTQKVLNSNFIQTVRCRATS